MLGDNETDFPHKVLLNNRQVENIRKAFANNSLIDIKLSKNRLSKMIQSRGFLGRLWGPLLKTGLPLIKNVVKPLATSVLITLGVHAAASTADARIHKKTLGLGNPSSSHNHPSSSTSHNTVLIISNDEIEDIIKIVKSLENSGLLLKGVTETVQNEVKEQKGGFLSALLSTLGASLLGDLLIGKGVIATSQGRGICRAGKGKGIVRAGYSRPSSSASHNKIDF